MSNNRQLLDLQALKIPLSTDIYYDVSGYLDETKEEAISQHTAGDEFEFELDEPYVLDGYIAELLRAPNPTKIRAEVQKLAAQAWDTSNGDDSAYLITFKELVDQAIESLDDLDVRGQILLNACEHNYLTNNEITRLISDHAQ